jgi:hypothetical protein
MDLRGGEADKGVFFFEGGLDGVSGYFEGLEMGLSRCFAVGW